MARLSAALAVVCLTTLLLGANGAARVVQSGDIEKMSWNDYLQFVCTNGFTVFPSYLCNPYTTTKASPTTMSTATTTTPTTTTTTLDDEDSNVGLGNTPSKSSPSTTTSTITTQSSSSSSPPTSPVSGSPLEHAHWCKFSNGSYLSLGQTFLYNDCAVCQCIQSRAIRCANLECMTTYCIDDSKPVTRPGQCCQQCAYDKNSTSCVVNGITFPTGTLLRQTTDSIQCWCQLGTVECRKSSGSALSSMDYFGDGTAVYVLVIVICVVLVIGTLLCCGGGFFFYYYYYNKNNQESTQDAYAQYYSNAGWQPMADDAQVVVDGVAQEKQVEAEQQQYQQQYPTGQTEEYIPPPYALYNGAHLSQSSEKEQRFA